MTRLKILYRSGSPSKKGYGGDRFMPQLNKDAHLVPTDDDKTDYTVASVLGKDQPNILSFNQRPKEWIFAILYSAYLPFLTLCLFT